MNQEAETDYKLEKFYGVTWRQCIKTINTKTKACEKYVYIRYERDTIKLLKIIKDI